MTGVGREPLEDCGPGHTVIAFKRQCGGFVPSGPQGEGGSGKAVSWDFQPQQVERECAGEGRRPCLCSERGKGRLCVERGRQGSG